MLKFVNIFLSIVMNSYSSQNCLFCIIFALLFAVDKMQRGEKPSGISQLFSFISLLTNF